MKWVGAVGCLVFILWASSLVLLAANAQWPFLAAQLAVGATAAAVWAHVRARRAERRMAALAGILTEHYRMDRPVVSIGMLVPVLGDTTLEGEAADYRYRRDTEAAMRYANGESSDF